MSRRKQPNPKPLKLSAEDGSEADTPDETSDNADRHSTDTTETSTELSTEGPTPCSLIPTADASAMTSDMVHIPTDILRLKIVGKNKSQCGIITEVMLPKGGSLGPFEGVSKDTDTVDENDIIQFSNEKGAVLSVAITKEESTWLRYVKRADSQSSANTIVFYGNEKIWCEIIRDLEPYTELIASFTFHDLDDVKKSQTVCNKLPASVGSALLKISPAVIDDVPLVNCALIFGCPYCSVRFSSPKTLDAHLRYYCARKPDDFILIRPKLEPNDKDLAHSDLISHEGDEKMRTVKQSEEERSETESPPDCAKKDSYCCGQCQYKTSRLSSLNKHMRLRSHLPTNATDQYLIQKPCKRETYCQGCNIQFSSMNTYSAHKEFYCSKRNQHPDTDESDNSTEALTQGSPTSPVNVSPAITVTALLSPGSTGSLSPESKLLQEQSAVILTAPVFMPNGITSMTFSVPSVLEQSSLLPERTKGDITPPKMCSSPRELVSDKPLDLSTKRKVTNTSNLNKENNVNETVKSPVADGATIRTLSKNTHGHISRVAYVQSPENLSVKTEEKPVNGSHPSKNVSKCNECNIVFYKFENFLIHKEHYCLSRRGKKFIPAHSVAETNDQSPDNMVSPNMDIVGGCSNSQAQHEDSMSTLMALESAAPHLQYKCLHCNIRFSSVDTLKAHKQYYCPHDKTNERSISSPESHDECPDSAMEDPCYSCPQCNNAFSTNRLLRQHYCSRSTKTSLKCLYCDHIANSDNRMADHIKVHVPSKAFRCTLCGYRGNTSRGMRMHGKMHVDNGEEFSELNMVEYEEPPMIPAQMNSSSDHSLLDPEAELIRLKNEPYKRRRSRKSFEKSDFSSSSPFLPTTGCICMLCGDALPDPNSFLIHMRLHELTYIESHMVHSCKSCDFVAESKDSLSSHMKVAHDRTFPRHETVETISDTVKCENSKPDSTTVATNPDSNTEKSDQHIVKIKEEPMDTGYETREECHQTVDINQTVDIKQEKYSDIENCTRKRCHSAPTSTISENSFVPAKRSNKITSPAPLDFDDVSVPKSTEATSRDRENSQSIIECASPSALRKRKHNEEINILSTKAMKIEVTSPNSPSTIHSATFQIIPYAASVLSPSAGTTRCERENMDTKYCKRCDISFTYLSSFVAHKKYYCVGRPSEEFPHLAIA